MKTFYFDWMIIPHQATLLENRRRKQ